MRPDAYYGTRVRVNKSRIVPKIYAVFCLNYIAVPFSIKIWYKTGFPSPDTYVYTQVQVRKIRMVRKIYAVFYLKYISNPFSVDLVQGGFCEPRRICIYASSGEKNSYRAEDLRRNFWFYISMPFSVKIWCKTGFPSPDAYVYTRVRVRKIRIVPKIYAVIVVLYIIPV